MNSCLNYSFIISSVCSCPSPCTPLLPCWYPRPWRPSTGHHTQLYLTFVLLVYRSCTCSLVMPMSNMSFTVLSSDNKDDGSYKVLITQQTIPGPSGPGSGYNCTLDNGTSSYLPLLALGIIIIIFSRFIRGHWTRKNKNWINETSNVPGE